MKIPSIISAAIVYGASSTSSFVVLPASPAGKSAARLNMIGRESNVDLTGNSWKPDSEKMGVRLVRCRLSLFDGAARMHLCMWMLPIPVVVLTRDACLATTATSCTSHRVSAVGMIHRRYAA